MTNIQEIIKAIDKFLEENKQSTTTPVEISPYLEELSLLNDSSTRPGKPIRDKLREGVIHHAYQTGGKWIIPHSNSTNTSDLLENISSKKEVIAKRNILDQTDSEQNDIIKTIKKSLFKTKREINLHKDYPKKPRISAFILKADANLNDFGSGGNILYIGIAKKSLHSRDFNQHFKSGKTGSSTLRRSIGAILKDKLELTVIPRGEENDSKRFSNYCFKGDGENILTEWLKENLEIGYWVPKNLLPYTELRNLEKKTTIELKPTLDLDIRTKRFNPLANKLTQLRNDCKKQAEEVNT